MPKSEKTILFPALELYCFFFRIMIEKIKEIFSYFACRGTPVPCATCRGHSRVPLRSRSVSHSPYPPSALTRGRLAHFSEIGIYVGNSENRTYPDWNIVKHGGYFTLIPFSLPCSHTSFRHFSETSFHSLKNVFELIPNFTSGSQPSWLHFVFPSLALGSFPFFNTS